MIAIAAHEEEFLQQVRAFCRHQLQPKARELDRDSRFPKELLPEMRTCGLFGSSYDPQYGGRGYSFLTAYAVLTLLAKASAGVALTLIVQWMAVDVLRQFGTEQQKQTYLPGLIRGEKIATYTISEVQAGSDAAAITTTATARDGGWQLDGAKFFATNGGLAEVYIIAAKTAPELGAKGISLFLVEKGTPGFTVGPSEEKLGCRSSRTTALHFDHCLIRDDQRIGPVNGGFKIAMYGLVSGRLGMAAMGLGIAEAALQDAVSYANTRVVFGKPLVSLFAIQEKIADMYVQIQAAEHMVRAAAEKRDTQAEYSLEASTAKLFVSRVITDICHQALQIYGGHGYMKYNDVERYARDARLLDIGVGASEVLKMVVGMTIAKDIRTTT
ncbi:butyryl-CoA dehydrogenase [Megasphaera paucivorans]|uniref:Butyryl-CoA dehydrogenase n=2 Tax=Megasphaera paucivorans TaxID=349095 RepID=A0A1G9SGR8_9FIRM|nr:butyryl-CoA dehydrogenase [Megasphaera paucivorans]